jgi:hypothetical protein
MYGKTSFGIITNSMFTGNIVSSKIYVYKANSASIFIENWKSGKLYKSYVLSNGKYSYSIYVSKGKYMVSNSLVRSYGYYAIFYDTSKIKLVKSSVKSRKGLSNVHKAI